MRNFRHWSIPGLAFLLGFLFLSGCEDQKLLPGDGGLLKGIISIGPICPVETIPPDPGCLPTADTYKAYPVSIWTSDGKKKVAQILPKIDGSFTTELPPGDYLVILDNNQNGIGSSNLPVRISVFSKDTTTLDINIDTGIR
jgi:hypothetical protein